ncbi:MAG: lysozyme inhibitor LprI family protein [Paracoccaceae bacterium]
MRILALAVLVFGAGFAVPVQAQAVNCSNAMTQMDINACAAADFNAADAALNAAYGQARDAMRRMDSGLPAHQAGAEIALRDAQRAWISFRDLACIAEGFQMRGGSAEQMLVVGCKARLTQQRAQDLWTLALGMQG